LFFGFHFQRSATPFMGWKEARPPKTQRVWDSSSKVHPIASRTPGAGPFDSIFFQTFLSRENSHRSLRNFGAKPPKR